MEHNCYSCGAGVEDGTAFCPHCSAPQIRVVTTDGGLQEKILPELAARKDLPRSPPASSKIDWSQTWAAVFLGLFIAFALSLVFPAGGLPIGMLATGYLSVYLYHRRHPFNRLSLGLGARLGTFTGALGLAVLVVICGMAIFVSGAELHALVLKAVQQYAAGHNSDPQMRQIVEIYSSKDGFILVVFFTFAMFMCLSGVGGIVGAAVLRRKQI